MVDIPFGNVIFRFRRDPADDMKFRCVCGTNFSSRQSLYNHVKGSSQWATECRKPCDIIVMDFHATESNPSIFGEKKDDDRQPVNVWLADEEEIIQANQASEQWALVASSDTEDLWMLLSNVKLK
ncbi:hypothetical protein BGZ99_002677 [Dissophora globulifera]|uniref:Uncharacterized protein n=1 Tax=Dissophora globulifera TaxID=979702 RepID=A0A9P6UX75_9FUNG|nr:hypothetical protein BGZ99_002677 [Dissophora globulifera]